MFINNCDLCLRKKSSSQAPKARFRCRQFLILEIRMLRQKEHGSKQARLVFSAQHNNVGMWRFDQLLERRGKLWAAPSSWIQCQETMDYACAPPREKTRLNQMTISNTLAVRSGRLLTAPSIRGRGFALSAHSYDVAFMSELCFPWFCIAFHCILINTSLNQARTTLLITQDKRTRQKVQ